MRLRGAGLRSMDTLGFEPRAFRVRSGCDATTPCALEGLVAGSNWLLPGCSKPARRLLLVSSCLLFAVCCLLCCLWFGVCCLLLVACRLLFLVWCFLFVACCCGVRCVACVWCAWLLRLSILPGLSSSLARKALKAFRHRDLNPGHSGESRVS